MSPNKRKTFDLCDFDDDISFKQRRSSLRVNLSYLSDLSDSGNGSLRKAQFEIEETEQTPLNRNASTSKGRNYSNKQLMQEDLPGSYKERFNLRELSVSLVAITDKEQALTSNCNQLKDAILKKTKEIFDNQNELSIKTTNVLTQINNPNINLRGKPRECLPNFNRNNSKIPVPLKTIKNQIVKRSVDQPVKPQTVGSVNLESTPKHTNKDSTVSDKSRCINKRRLFINKEDQPLSDCSVIKSVTNSPILSGSSRYRNIRFRKKLSLRQISKLCTESPNLYFGTCSQSSSSIASIPENDNLCTGNFLCSTFIRNSQDSDKESENCNEEKIDNEESMKGCTPDIHMSSEPTVQLIIVESDSLSEQNKESPDLSKQIETDISDNKSKTDMKSNTEIIKNRSIRSLSLKQRSILAASSKSQRITQQTNDSNQRKSDSSNDGKSTESITIRMDVPMELTAIHNPVLLNRSSNLNVNTKLSHNENNILENNEQHEIEDESIKTVRSSLRMNTSIDSLNDKEEVITDADMQLINTEIDDSVHTARSSLQVNTSLDSVHRALPKIINVQTLTNHKQIVRNLERSGKDTSTSTNNSDCEKSSASLNNTSSSKNMKNNCTQTYNDCNCDSVELLYVKEVECKESDEKNEVQPEKDENDRRKSSSYIEGTPYPACSVILQSHLKQSTVIQNSNTKTSITESNKKIPETFHSRITRSSAKLDKMLCSTIIIGDSPCMNSPPENQKPVIFIDDSTDGNKSIPATNESSNKITNVVRGKRKLLPLCQEDLVSFSPVQERSPQPKQPELIIRRKKNKKRLNKASPVSNDKKTNAEKSRKKVDFDQADIKKKGNKKPRRVLSKKIVVRKFPNQDLMDELERHMDRDKSQSMSNRSSFVDFETNKKLPTRWNHNKSEKIIIVTTGLSKGDKSLVKSVVQTLGAAQLESHVTRRTTHIVSTGVRTINLLHGIIRGCWLVSLEWVLKSLEENKWLDPTDYEMTHFSKAVQENRKDRQLFGPSYIPELFATCGFIYVENGTTPPSQTLKDLIKSAGGRISEDFRHAKILIGSEGLKETWVLDSITTGELQPVHQYQRK